jgi:hypothetical protein
MKRIATLAAEYLIDFKAPKGRPRKHPALFVCTPASQVCGGSRSRGLRIHGSAEAWSRNRTLKGSWRVTKMACTVEIATLLWSVPGLAGNALPQTSACTGNGKISSESRYR